MSEIFSTETVFSNSWQTPDPWGETRPMTGAEPLHSQRKGDPYYSSPQWMKPRRRRAGCGPCGCSTTILLALLAGLIFAIYALLPIRTNILLLGIDYTPPGSAVGRSDTMILTTIIPLEPYVGMLSIPRDLWVSIPGEGENRINTAHFFAESQQPGAGPPAAMQAVSQNFGVDVDYYIRIRFDGFKDVVNAMGGVDIDLPEPMAGYPVGRNHLTGNKALAFARNRLGSDDFFRMQRGQLLLKAVFKQLLQPQHWIHIPAVLIALNRSLDTDIPTWMWPRLGIALLRAGPSGIDNRTMTREMAVPYVTDQGANILLPQWSQINPVLMEMFGQ